MLLDGLQAEREQRVTIDVAYRYFGTARRRFIVADAPGHEQYTRNMATAASTADLAGVLVDARKGVLTQTQRHTRIVGLMGIRHVVLAVNKMDCVDYRQDVFDEIAGAYALVAMQCGVRVVQPIPVSATAGDNLLQPSTRAPWYEGPTLLSYLESVELSDGTGGGHFRMPVQLVNRPNQDFRGYCGRVSAGVVHPGDYVGVWPSGVTARVATIIGRGPRTGLREGWRLHHVDISGRGRCQSWRRPRRDRIAA